jgi:hypothetical protein
MKARLGTPKAITAPAPKLARLIYAMLRQGTAYVRQSLAAYEQHDRDRAVQSLMRRAKVLGYTLVQTPAGTPRSRAHRRSSSLEGLLLSIGERLPVRKSEAFFRPTQRALLAC